MVATIVSGSYAVAQDAPDMRHVWDFYRANLDMDGEGDFIWYDVADSAIVLRLSSRGYEDFSVRYPLAVEDGYPRDHLLIGDKGEFLVMSPGMRCYEYDAYRYETVSGRFRLVKCLHKNYGNAANDGMGTMSLDLLTGIFTGEWTYYDYEAEKLVPLPKVTVLVDNPPIYLDGDRDFRFPGDELYGNYKEAYAPDHEFTAVFDGFLYNYDYPTICVTLSDGESWEGPVAGNYEELYKGDLLRLTQGTYCYEEPGDGSFRAGTMVTDIEVVGPGPLRRFLEGNRKTMDYAGDSQYVDDYERRRLAAIDYYFAVGGDKCVGRYFRKPGVLRVVFHDIDNRDSESPNVCFLAEIYNEDGGKRQLLRKLVLEMFGDFGVRYWLADEPGPWTLLDIE